MSNLNKVRRKEEIKYIKDVKTIKNIDTKIIGTKEEVVIALVVMW